MRIYLSEYFAKLCRVSAIAIFVLSLTEMAQAQEPEQTSPVRFSLVRSFSLPNVPVEDLQSELFNKEQGDAVMADIVDLNLEFSNVHGKPSIIPPQFAPKTHTMIFRFPDNWWTLNMVRADGQGAFVCRVKARMFEPKPGQADFAKYIDWCHAILTLATLDSGLLSVPAKQ